MSSITRKGDKCTGHNCFPSRSSTQGSPNVFVNSLAAHRQGDTWASHGCATCPPHGGALASGSSSVYVNDKQIGRIGDSVDCGSSVAEGSINVFAGD